jgi:hypothetical protein
LKLAAQAGVAPAPFRLTGGRTTVIPPGSKNGGPEGQAMPAPIKECNLRIVPVRMHLY